MNSIQVFLITLSLFAAILSSVAFGSRLIYRLLGIFLFVTSAGFIMFPDSTTTIANIMGVRRGTDLLLYVSLFAGVHGFLLLYIRTRRLERKLTEQIRALAIRDARNLAKELDTAEL